MNHADMYDINTSLVCNLEQLWTKVVSRIVEFPIKMQMMVWVPAVAYNVCL